MFARPAALPPAAMRTSLSNSFVARTSDSEAHSCRQQKTPEAPALLKRYHHTAILSSGWLDARRPREAARARKTSHCRQRKDVQGTALPSVCNTGLVRAFFLVAGKARSPRSPHRLSDADSIRKRFERGFRQQSDSVPTCSSTMSMGAFRIDIRGARRCR